MSKEHAGLRLMSLADELAQAGKFTVQPDGNDTYFVQVNRTTRAAWTYPHLRCTLHEYEGVTTLAGRIVSPVLPLTWLFTAVIIFMALFGQEGFPGAALVGGLVWGSMLELQYQAGRNDPETIMTAVEQALLE